MKATEQTIQQLERMIRKIAQKFPTATNEEVSALTDIHLRVSQDSGELVAFDDDDNEITRCVVEQWINNQNETFFDDCTQILQACLNQLQDVAGNLGIMKPYSFVLESDEGEHVSELYLADDETVIIGGDLMTDLEEDLKTFLNHLLETEK